MGNGFQLVCKHCTYSKTFLLGFGMGYSELNKTTIKKIRKGVYGQEWQQLLTDYPNGQIDTESCLYVCPYCNTLSDELKLSFYKIRDKSIPDYGLNLSDNKRYELVKEYVHRCPQCSGRMKRIMDPHNTSYICPKCDTTLIKLPGIRWD